MSLQDSSNFVFGYDAPATPSPQHEWDRVDRKPAKSKIMDYGYIIKDKAVGCTRQELIETLVHRRKEVSFVWTPEMPAPVRPEQVPFLIESFRRIEVKDALIYLCIGALVLFAGFLGVLGDRGWDPVASNLCFFVGGTALAAGNWKYWRARNYTQEDAASAASDTRFTNWLKKRSVSGYTITIIASMILVTVLQGVAVDGAARVGLVKPAVWRGEFWRLFTGSLMYQSFSYIYGGTLLLIHFSKVIEQAMQRAFVPLLFLASAVVGNLFSVILQPHTPSAGAYGGIMGLLGFIVISAYLDRTKFPPGYFKRMLAMAVALGAVGLLFFGFIDSAANLGGLWTGVTLGWLSTKWKRAPITGKLLRLGSAAGVLGVVATAVFAIYRLIA
jgi:membrane associated rhomboid family serine protease